MASPTSTHFGVLPGTLPPEPVIFGRSGSMRLIRQKLEKLAGANIPVLIQGENGTGKEVLARFLHQRSPWRDGPFVKINCPAIPGTLLESELFGYERGAFTGAYNTKPGRVELAHRGTLFLDEIAELDPSLQAKLLHLLQDGQFCRIGAREDTRVEVRIICATNRQLEQEVETGAFRQDLFYRINVISMHLPPLRERGEDIPDLVAYFLSYYNHKENGRAYPLSPPLLQLFRRYHWPGNIRQLENLVRQYVILGSEEAISSELLGQQPEAFEAEVPADEPLSLKKLTRTATQNLERKLILKVLQDHQWNRKQTARALNISYRTLLYKIKAAGVPPRWAPLTPRPVEGASDD